LASAAAHVLGVAMEVIYVSADSKVQLLKRLLQRQSEGKQLPAETILLSHLMAVVDVCFLARLITTTSPLPLLETLISIVTAETESQLLACSEPGRGVAVGRTETSGLVLAARLLQDIQKVLLCRILTQVLRLHLHLPSFSSIMHVSCTYMYF
jgi:hypothetical protein